MTADYRSLVSAADIFYAGPVGRKYEGMPVGNGVTGSLVWTEPDRMKFQINRVDVFAANGATSAGEPDMFSPDYLGGKEYCGGCAWLDIAFGDGVFTQEDTVSHLSLYDAALKLDGKNLTAGVRVWADRDVFCIDMTDLRSERKPVTIALTMLRDRHIVTKGHTAHCETGASGDRITLTQEFSEKCSTGITENDHYCASAVSVCAAGCSVQDVREEATRVILTVMPEGKLYSVYAACGASFRSVPAARAAADDALEAALSAGPEIIVRTHESWWHDYWSRSYIDTPCSRDFTLYWYSYLYFIGATMRGSYPAKFNGLLFNCDGDYRVWGGQYWWYNQSRTHYGLDAAGHGDRNAPLFGMLLNNISRYEKACDQQWGGKGGIFLPETDGFSGPEILPNEIARDLKALLLHDVPATERLNEFMKNRSGLNSRWALFESGETQKEGDLLSFHWHSNLSYNTGDAANSMWNHYLYTKDRAWLERIYPWLKGAARFYQFYPCREQGEDGYSHFNHLGWAESITHATDVIDDLVMMRGLYKTVITASEILGRDEELREGWRRELERIPPYPTSEEEGSVSNWYHPDGFPTYAVARKPCKMEWDGNTNDCRLRMLQVFDLVTLETKKSDPSGFELAERSFEATEVGRMLAAGEVPGFAGFAWNRGLVEAARLGRTDIVRTGLPALADQFRHTNGGSRFLLPNRLLWHEREKSYSIQEIGVFSDQLQEPLLQSVADGAGKTEAVIYVFPAWPAEWDASFELPAKGGFLVHSCLKNGKIPYIQITSQAGEVCSVHNPWPGQTVLTVCGGRTVLVSSEETITFGTDRGSVYRLTVSGEGTKVTEDAEVLNDAKDHKDRKDTEVSEEMDITAQSEKTEEAEAVKAPAGILFDELRVKKPSGGLIARIAPEQSTKIRIRGVESAIFKGGDDTILRVNGTILTGLRPGETVVRAFKDGRNIAEERVRVCMPVISDYDPQIRYGGVWKSKVIEREGFYEDCCHLTDEKGAAAELTFTGCGIELYGAKDIGYSSAEISLDGREYGTAVSDGTERRMGQLLCRIWGLERGTHTLRIVNQENRTFVIDYFRIIV